MLRLAQSSDSARADAYLLLAHLLKRDRAWLLAHGEAYLAHAQVERFEELCAKREAGMPVAYLLGSAMFFGREFTVSDAVLVPRPESEHLIDAALAYLLERKGTTTAMPRVLDVGTGSGALGCTMAAEIAQANVECVDISPMALAMAHHNARRLHVHRQMRFYLGDLLAPLGERAFDLVLANLPYVPSHEIAPPPDPVSFEPRLALDGGPDGLDLYRRLLADLPRYLAPQALVLCEAAPSSMPGLCELLAQALPRARITVGSDFGGRERFASARLAQG